MAKTTNDEIGYLVDAFNGMLAEIGRRAVRRVRSQYRDRPDPKGLLPQPFTMRELRQLHAAVAGVPPEDLKPDTFSRRMEPQLQDTGRTTGRAGRCSGTSRRSTFRC